MTQQIEIELRNILYHVVLLLIKLVLAVKPYAAPREKFLESSVMTIDWVFKLKIKKTRKRKLHFEMFSAKHDNGSSTGVGWIPCRPPNIPDRSPSDSRHDQKKPFWNTAHPSQTFLPLQRRLTLRYHLGLFVFGSFF